MGERGLARACLDVRLLEAGGDVVLERSECVVLAVVHIDNPPGGVDENR